MNQIVSYVRSFLALFIVITLLLQLVSGEHLKKYIRFFAGMMLSFGVLYPVFSFFYDSEDFLKLIQYETFEEELTETARAVSRMEYISSDYYLVQYEEAVEGDAALLVDECIAPYGLTASEVEVKLTEEYAISKIELTISRKNAEDIEVERIMIGTAMESGNEKVMEIVKEELKSYYRIEENAIQIKFAGGG